MNKSESDYFGNSFRRRGLIATNTPAEASVIVINSCVVRQKAEDKVINKISSLKDLKRKNPGIKIILAGCMVNSNINELKQTYPYVDLFLNPQSYDLLDHWLQDNSQVKNNTVKSPSVVEPPVSGLISVMQGCNNFCTYCIVPFRRGREKSRPIDGIKNEIENLVPGGMKEVTLLGQNINSYGRDLIPVTGLDRLILNIHSISGLKRIRFLTSHPRDVDFAFINRVFALDKVCKHISLPVQSGNDDILKAMGRSYSVEDYCRIISYLRALAPDFAISTDIIVGFPGETPLQFQSTFDLISELKFDTVHVASYSPRPGTAAARMADSIHHEEKERRQQAIEDLQTSISQSINNTLVNKPVEVLVENKKDHKWYGRTPRNKLVFFESGLNCRGRLSEVMISRASAWSLTGNLIKFMD